MRELAQPHTYLGHDSMLYQKLYEGQQVGVVSSLITIHHHVTNLCLNSPQVEMCSSITRSITIMSEVCRQAAERTSDSNDQVIVYINFETNVYRVKNLLYLYIVADPYPVKSFKHFFRLHW